MADDWTKLVAAYKSLEPKLTKSSLEDCKDLWKGLQSLDKAMEAHEKKLGAAAIAAYEAGVISKKLAEFLKDKGFADAKKQLDGDRKLLVTDLKDLLGHCDTCKAGAAAGADLASQMAKALAAEKSKDKNPARDAVKKLRLDLVETVRALTEANNIRFQVPKYMTVFDSQYDKLIDHLIAEALKKGKDPEDQLEVPQPLTDKKLGALVKEAARYGGSINASILKKEEFEAKLKKDQDKNPSSQTVPAGMDTTPLSYVDKAKRTFAKLEAIAAEAEALKKKFKAEIALLKEKTEILKQFKSIELEVEKAKSCIDEGTVSAKKIT